MKRPVPNDRLRRPDPGNETLERLKRWPSLRRNLLPEGVCIWSGEHRAYWRQGGRGYVAFYDRRIGVWSLDEALKLTRHCGPEKKIEFHSLF